MSYEPTEWKTGDVVTSAKLNKLEQGVADAGGILVLPAPDNTGALSETWQTIYDTASAGTLVFINYNVEVGTPNVFHDIVSEIGVGDGSVAEEGVYFVSTMNNQLFTTADSDGYPASPPINPINPDSGQ